jgi:hypothetical protein
MRFVQRNVTRRVNNRVSKPGKLTRDAFSSKGGIKRER